jgi:catechol 2,3-dioxygenase-like lactoylglutathione lyase family enzyme
MPPQRNPYRLLHRTVTKPRGRYTARLRTRLPIARFRRCSINRQNRKWLHPGCNNIGRQRRSGPGPSGLALRECGRPDPEATAAWLEDILGGVIIRNPGRIDVKLGGANVFIAPVTAGDGVNTPPVTPYQGLDHFGLTVKDIDAVAAEIKAKGVEFTKEPTTIRPGVRICFIRGPQGISVELLERDKKYA